MMFAQEVIRELTSRHNKVESKYFEKRKVYLLRAGAQACDCNRDRLWVRFPLKEITNLIFSFLRSGADRC